MSKILKTSILSASFLVISVILSAIFDFSLSNTWQGGVAVVLVFAPFWVYAWGLSTKLKHLPFLCYIIRFFLVAAVVGYALATYILIRDGIILL